MNNEKRTNGQDMVKQDSEFEPDFTEIEIGRLTDAEYEMANLRHEIFLEEERAGRGTLDRQFEEELEQLLKTIKAEDGQTIESDPPGWPGL
ncbi:MAG: hypothetical protein L0220_18015 [Acidobacteria bacterium]|nr:hypothetical protein [Acidobacteriota bacterium]